MDGWLEELSSDECLDRLRAGEIGRVAVLQADTPVVFPVNYRVVELGDRVFVALRTRPGNVIDRASTAVAFEIDGIDPAHRSGWSVLIRGHLRRVDPRDEAFREVIDSHPWIEQERDAWLMIEPVTLSGRRLRPPEIEWAFHSTAYL